jgi:diacylglycerol kinase family enzyme
MEVDANAMGGFLVINPRSGQGSNIGVLQDAATRLGIETYVLGPGEDAAEVARGAPQTLLGMAGGDGSLSAVADVAVERAVPFVAVPFGTFNHFARDLGIDRNDPAEALRAFSGRERTIDVARVNSRLFLNNVSLGLYARLVHRRQGRGKAALLNALGLLARHPGGLRVTVDGNRAHARVLVVSNNYYDLELFSVGERKRLDEGLLYLYVAHGLLPNTWEEKAGRRFVLDARGGSLEAAIDGEPTTLETPIRFETEPAELRVLLPDDG